MKARPRLAVDPDGQMQARDARVLLAETGQDPLDIFGFDPRAQELGRDRQMRDVVEDLLHLQPLEP